MKLLPLVAFFAALALAGASAAEEKPPATPKPGMLNRLLHPFGGGPAGKGKDLRGLEMKLAVEPAAPKLGDVREVKATVTVANKGKKLVQLEFPTTQRIEVLVKNKAGKMVLQWSEDQAFTNEPTLVTINPGERLEYAATLSTRDLVAGESYTVEAFFPNFDVLRKAQALTPVK